MPPVQAVGTISGSTKERHQRTPPRQVHMKREAGAIARSAEYFSLCTAQAVGRLCQGQFLVFGESFSPTPGVVLRNPHNQQEAAHQTEKTCSKDNPEVARRCARRFAIPSALNICRRNAAGSVMQKLAVVHRQGRAKAYKKISCGAKAASALLQMSFSMRRYTYHSMLTIAARRAKLLQQGNAGLSDHSSALSFQNQLERL